MDAMNIWERFAARTMIQKSYRTLRTVASTLGLLVGLGLGFGLSRIVAG